MDIDSTYARGRKAGRKDARYRLNPNNPFHSQMSEEWLRGYADGYNEYNSENNGDS